MGTSRNNLSKTTQSLNAGRAPHKYGGIVNPPLYRASTITFPSVAALMEAEKHWDKQHFYGRYGTEPTFAFEQAVAALEGGYRSVAVSCGVAALTTAILAFVKPTDHILVSDGVYGPTRLFCEQFLKPYGVDVTYYEPTISERSLTDLMQGNTKVLYLESPSSLTFEMQDVQGLCRVAKAKGITTIMDNTWGTPIGCASFAHGVDVSIHAATKYIMGHSDGLLGLISCNEASYKPVRQMGKILGHSASADDVYMAARGLRTLPVRLAQHQASALTIVERLLARPEVAQVWYPAHSSHPQHALWRRDFTHACGLFSFVLDERYNQAQAHRFVDALTLFGIGFSWGGYESLVLPVNLQGLRHHPTAIKGQVIRLHVGLEDGDDLWDDMVQAFKEIA